MYLISRGNERQASREVVAAGCLKLLFMLGRIRQETNEVLWKICWHSVVQKLALPRTLHHLEISQTSCGMCRAWPKGRLSSRWALGFGWDIWGGGRGERLRASPAAAWAARLCLGDGGAASRLESGTGIRDRAATWWVLRPSAQL